MPSSEVMHKFKHHQLHSGSKGGPLVKSRAQAIAVMLSEKRAEGHHGGKYPEKRADGGSASSPKIFDPKSNRPGWPPLPPLDLSLYSPNTKPPPEKEEGGGQGFTGVPPRPMGVPKPPMSMPPGQGPAPQMPQWPGLGGGGLGQMPPTGQFPQFPQGFSMPQGFPRADGGNVIRMPGAATPPQRVFNALSTDDLNKLTTNRTLMNALGGGAKVLPFTLDDGKAAGGPISTKGGVEGAKKYISALYNISPEGYENRLKQQGQEASDIAASVPRGLGDGYQFGGSPTSMGLTPGWIERQEARNISHTGPILSTVGGRTDNHSINVPSGSYVLPAAHVSALGQGNTLNGMKILQGMFGPPMRTARGAGPPRMHAPPSLMPKTPGLGLSSSGGSRGDNTGRPVPIMAAGGEFVLSPDQVAKVGKGDIDHGHAILDHWVKNTHKKYAKTVANLPPPAKT